MFAPKRPRFKIKEMLDFPGVLLTMDGTESYISQPFWTILNLYAKTKRKKASCQLL